MPNPNLMCGLRKACSSFLVVFLVSLGSSQAEVPAKPEEIPKLLYDRGKNLSAFKAVMNVTTMNEMDKSRQEIRGFLLYRRPSDFRFQGLGSGGATLFELVMKSTTFELYVPQEGKIIKGDRDCFARKFPDVAEIEGLIPMVLLQWRDVRFDRVLSRDQEKVVIRMTFQGRVWGATLDARSLIWYDWSELILEETLISLLILVISSRAKTVGCLLDLKLLLRLEDGVPLRRFPRLNQILSS